MEHMRSHMLKSGLTKHNELTNQHASFVQLSTVERTIPHEHELPIDTQQMSARPAARSLTAFTSGFSDLALLSSFSVCAFLAPAAESAIRKSSCSGRSPRPPAYTYRGRRQFSTINKSFAKRNKAPAQDARLNRSDISSDRSVFSNVSGSTLTRKPRTRSPTSKKAAKRFAQLDLYLPLELRSGTWLENLAGFEGVRSAESLPALLDDAREVLGFGLLSHLAIQSERWEALLFLTKALLQVESELRGQDQKREPHRDLYQGSPWLDWEPESSLAEWEQYNKTVIKFSTPSSGSSSTELLSDVTDLRYYRSKRRELSDLAIGEIWECLGYMLVNISQAEPEVSLKVMPYIQQILADMHTYGIISPLIYQYESTDVPSHMRKSVFLHAMSSRIMASLSESVWKTVEHETIKDAALNAATHAYRDHEVTGITGSPQIRVLDLGVWLELVLWSCVHANYYDQGIKLIIAISNARSRQRWSMIDWKEVDSLASERLSRLTERSKARSWFKRLAGISEGYSEEPSFFELPKYRISREVVLVILHRALCGTRHSDPTSMPSVQNALRAYESLTNDAEKHDEEHSRHSSLIDSLDEASNTSSLDLRLFHLYNEVMEPAVSAGFEGSSPLLDPSLLRFHSKHAVLVSGFVEAISKGDLSLSMSSFRSIQNLFNDSRPKAPDVSGPEVMDESSPHGFKAWFQSPAIALQTPLSSLAALLDLITESKQLKLAPSLLESLPKEMVESSAFQPALLRYAVAASDFRLLTIITQCLHTDVSTYSSDILCALLYCQIQLGKFSNARDLLDCLQNERNYLLGAKDIINIACKLIEMETSQASTEALDEIQEILEYTLSRGFVPRTDLSQPPDYTPYRMLNQLARIFSTLPGRLSHLSTLVSTGGQATVPTFVPRNAFNTLLSTVSQALGPEASQKLFATYCRLPAHMPRKYLRGTGFVVYMDRVDEERVVAPNFESLRAVLRIAVEQLEAFNKDPYKARLEKGQGPEHNLLGWVDEIEQCRAEEDTSENVTESAHEIIVEHSDVMRKGAQPSTLPDHAPNKQLLEWGIKVFRLMGMNDAAIANEIPGALHVPAEVVASYGSVPNNRKRQKKADIDDYNESKVELVR